MHCFCGRDIKLTEAYCDAETKSRVGFGLNRVLGVVANSRKKQTRLGLGDSSVNRDVTDVSYTFTGFGAGAVLPISEAASIQQAIAS
jgi:hypothetical protein